MTTRTFMVTVEFEDECHCGAPMCGSDHCPLCGCEQYESYCKHRADDDEIRAIIMGGRCQGVWFINS